MSEWTDAPRPDLTAADWAAMRTHCVTEANVRGWQTYTEASLLTALDALARQQEANARLTEQNDALQEAAGESCHVCEYEWDNEWATVSTDRARSVVCAKCWDGSTALARALKAEAALADRDATIARLRDELVKEELLHDEQLRRALTGMDAEIARLREANARLTAARSHATCHDMECNTGPTLPRGVLGCSCQGRVDRALAERDATVKQAYEAHAASFGALATLSAALGDGEVDDYDALAQHAIDTVADRDAEIARLREAAREFFATIPGDTMFSFEDAQKWMALKKLVEPRPVPPALPPAKEADRG